MTSVGSIHFITYKVTSWTSILADETIAFKRSPKPGQQTWFEWQTGNNLKVNISSPPLPQRGTQLQATEPWGMGAGERRLQGDVSPLSSGGMPSVRQCPAGERLVATRRTPGLPLGAWLLPALPLLALSAAMSISCVRFLGEKLAGKGQVLQGWLLVCDLSME